MDSQQGCGACHVVLEGGGAGEAGALGEMGEKERCWGRVRPGWGHGSLLPRDSEPLCSSVMQQVGCRTAATYFLLSPSTTHP